MRRGDRIVVSPPVSFQGRILQSAPVLLFQLDNGEFSEERGYDHQPYSTSELESGTRNDHFIGRKLPAEVIEAAKSRAGVFLPDIDLRQMEWE